MTIDIDRYISEHSQSRLQLFGSGNSPVESAIPFGATSNAARDNEYILSGYRYTGLL